MDDLLIYLDEILTDFYSDPETEAEYQLYLAQKKEAEKKTA